MVRNSPPFCRSFCLVVDVLHDVPIEVVPLGSQLRFVNFVRASFSGLASGRLAAERGRRRHGSRGRRGTVVPLCQLDSLGKKRGNKNTKGRPLIVVLRVLVDLSPCPYSLQPCWITSHHRCGGSHRLEREVSSDHSSFLVSHSLSDGFRAFFNFRRAFFSFGVFFAPASFGFGLILCFLSLLLLLLLSFRCFLREVLGWINPVAGTVVPYDAALALVSATKLLEPA